MEQSIKEIEIVSGDTKSRNILKKLGIVLKLKLSLSVNSRESKIASIEIFSITSLLQEHTSCKFATWDTTDR